MNVLFDATVLANGLNKNGGRSGIYMVTYNLLSEFRKDSKLKISLYCAPERYLDFLRLEDSIVKDLPLYSNTSKISSFFYNKSCKNSTTKASNIFIRKAKNGLNRLYKKIGKLTEKKNISVISNKEFDAYFSPMHAIPKCIKQQNIRNHYVIIYDMIPYILPEYKTGLNGWFGEVISNLNKKDIYFTISDSVKQDFIRIKKYEIDENKVFTTYIGVSDSFKPELDEDKRKNVFEKYKIESDKYIFSLGSIEPRKNLRMQIKAFVTFVDKNKITDLVYVIGGGKYTTNLIEELRKENLDTTYIQYIGYVDDDDLNVLYTNALWFTFTSKYEGFGLPPLEAMKCGCPVITSNNSSLPEVCGTAALLVDCNSVTEHVSAYESLYNKSDLREELKKKGFEQSKIFNWKSVSDKMIRIMEEFYENDR